MSEIVLTAHQNNAAIKVHVFDEDIMRKIGFTDFAKDTWFFRRICIDDISFSLSIKKNNPNDWRIDILDDDFLQPYDYQYMLQINPTSTYPLKVQKRVEQCMKYLAENGVISGHNFGDYI